MRNLIDLVENAERDAVQKEWQEMLTRPDQDHETLSRFYQERVKPVEDRFRAAEKERARQERDEAQRQELERLALPPGFSTEPLYHGSDAEFTEFDRSFVKTASHIYTSPDRHTAEQYGDNLYLVYAKQAPQADLTIEASEDVAFWPLVKKLHRVGRFKASWDLSLKELTELITDGKLYDYSSSSRLQDDVIDTCLGMGYASVRITDGIPGASGGYSDSVIFADVKNLLIKQRLV